MKLVFWPNKSPQDRRKPESVNPAVFREYDIRGQVGRDFGPLEAYRLGRALGTYFQGRGARQLLVGRDCRLSSTEMAGYLTEALVASGCQVWDLGVCPTPVLYFAVGHCQADGGVMVTASHHPAEFNGFKICLGAQPVFGAEIRKIWELAASGEFVTGPGSLAPREMIPAYEAHLLRDLHVSRPLRVGVDGGHGTAGPIALALLRDLGCEVFPIHTDMDGRFPAHPPDPAVAANLSDLQELVQQHGLDLGVAYDGDGDRLGVVGPRGEIVWTDQLLMLFARDILKDHPGAAIIGEVKCSQTLYEDIARYGGRPIMSKAGRSPIKEKLEAEKALLAGEMTGHLFFADRYFGFDDAIYASGRLVELLARAHRSLTALLADLPQAAATPEIRWACPDHLKFQAVERLKQRLRGKVFYLDLDGVRCHFPSGWGLVRASNTQPALVLRFEAATSTRLREIQALVETFLKEEMAALRAQGGICL